MTKRAQYKGFVIGLIVAIAIPAFAATFNLFSPANGILVGNPSTYVTTAATSSNVRALWSGTCDATTFLRGDGACAPETGGGTVTSVALTMPSGFSVGGSPVTTSGTLAVTTTLNGLLAGNGSGFLLATSGNVTGVFSGTCNSTTFLRGDGSCQSPGGGGTVTSITAGTGITATPANPIVSSGTLAVDQAFAPTWTGQHTFTLAGPISTIDGQNFIARALTAGVTGVAYFRAQDSTGASIGYLGDASTGDNNLYLDASARDLNLRTITSGNINMVPAGGTVVVTGNVTVGGSSVCRADGTNCPAGITITTGSSTGTVQSCTTDPAPAITYKRVGNTTSGIVTVKIDGFTCTASGGPASVQVLTNAPGGFLPSGDAFEYAAAITNNNAPVVGKVRVQTSGHIIWYLVPTGGLTGTIGNNDNGNGDDVTYTYPCPCQN